MRLRRNDKGEFEEANDIPVTPELLILSKLESIEEKLQLISSKLDLEEKADYESSLKDDKVAMLTELQLEIEELKNEPACCQHYKRGVNRSSDIIQHKINLLTEGTDDR